MLGAQGQHGDSARGQTHAHRAAVMGLPARVHGSASVAGARSAEDNAVCGARGMCAKQLK